MGVSSFSQELSCPVDAARMFKACVIDSDNLIPKLLPQFIKSIDVIQGEGAVGTIEQVNFTADSQFSYARHRIDELDRENLVLKYTIFEGDVLGNKLGSIASEVKFEAASGGGCTCKMTSSYHVIGEAEINEEEIQEGKDQAMGIFKVVEAYLLENPNAYA